MSMQTGAYRDMSVPRPPKNAVLAYVLWFFFGALGAHRYYVGLVKSGLLFLLGTLVAVGLSAVNTPATWIIGGIIWFVVFVFWVIDAFKLPKLVAAAGASPAITHE